MYIQAHQATSALLLLALLCACAAPKGLEVSVGGRLREQFEHFRNREFGQVAPRRDSYLLHRLQLRGEARLGDDVEGVVEFVNALTIDQDTPIAPIDEDRFDLLRAHVDWTPSFDTLPDLRARIGRQELLLGRGRLVSTREGPNLRRAFDGARLTIGAGPEARTGATFDVFALAPVDPGRRVFDDKTTDDEWLFGGQVSAPIGAELLGELYYLGRTRDDASLPTVAGDEERQTFGARLAGVTGPLIVDLEAIGQIGTIGGDDIAAFALSAIVEHEFGDTIWKPRPGCRIDWVSGDHDRDDGRASTFDALYPNNSYFNEAAAFAPANLRSIIPTLGLRPTERVTIDILWDFAWRDSTSDAVYAPPGVPAFPVDATRARFVGHSITTTAEWQVRDDLALTAAFTHLEAGPAITDAGGRDLDYLAIWVNWWF